MAYTLEPNVISVRPRQYQAIFCQLWAGPMTLTLLHRPALAVSLLEETGRIDPDRDGIRECRGRSELLYPRLAWLGL